MKGKRWIAVALVCLAGVGIGGCSIFTGALEMSGRKVKLWRGWISIPSASSQERRKAVRQSPQNGAGIHSAFPGCRTGNESRTDGGWRELS
ncbi:MAG: hypothetical protein ACLVG5_07375 [Clostridium sp.]